MTDETLELVFEALLRVYYTGAAAVFLAGMWLLAQPHMVGCVPPMPPEMKAPTPLPPPRIETCESACANAEALGCETGKPTPAGATCSDVCRNLERANLSEARWPIACVAEATNCSTLDACQ